MLSDLRLALRQLAKSPGFTVVAVLILALGVGLLTSMFSIVSTLLFPDLPYREPAQLVRLFRTAPQSQSWPHAPANFLDYQAQNRSCTALAAFINASFNYTPAGQPAESLRGYTVTADFFSILGTPAALGRTFLPEEFAPGGPPVVLLNHECWLRRFGGDPAVLGRVILLDGQPATVVGVMPAGFAPPLVWGVVDAWRPLPIDAGWAQVRDSNYLRVVGRLRPGVSPAQADRDFQAIAARLAADHPEANSSTSARIAALGSSSRDNATRYASWMLLGLAGFVLHVLGWE